jgi:hypothetical protein
MALLNVADGNFTETESSGSHNWRAGKQTSDVAERIEWNRIMDGMGLDAPHKGYN